MLGVNVPTGTTLIYKSAILIPPFLYLHSSFFEYRNIHLLLKTACHTLEEVAEFLFLCIKIEAVVFIWRDNQWYPLCHVNTVLFKLCNLLGIVCHKTD